MRRLTLMAAVTVFAVGCGITTNPGGGNAAVVLSITKVQGAEIEGTSPTWVDHLLSDVEICGSVVNDDAQVSVLAQPKNPDYVQTNSTGLNDVLLQSYAVHFIRSDGHQTQGVDVPYDFSGSLSGVVPLKSTTPVNAVIEVVRHSAKLEPPLVALVGGGGEDLIDTVAQITVYGRTVSGSAVSATGYLQVTFGDFADPKTCPFGTPSASPSPSPTP